MRPISIVCFAFTFASIMSFIGTGLWYATTRPTSPDAATGRVYVHPWKMSRATYLTASEETGLSLLPFAFIVGMGLNLFAWSKEPRDPTSPTGQMKEHILTRRDYLMLWGAIVFYVAMIIFIGPSFTDFLVSRGMTLYLRY